MKNYSEQIIEFYTIHIPLVLCHFVNVVQNLFANPVVVLRMNVRALDQSLVNLAISKENNQENNNNKNSETMGN